jgi:hypothetical protein
VVSNFAPPVAVNAKLKVIIATNPPTQEIVLVHAAGLHTSRHAAATISVAERNISLSIFISIAASVVWGLG